MTKRLPGRFFAAVRRLFRLWGMKLILPSVILQRIYGRQLHRRLQSWQFRTKRSWNFNFSLMKDRWCKNRKPNSSVRSSVWTAKRVNDSLNGRLSALQAKIEGYQNHQALRSPYYALAQVKARVEEQISRLNTLIPVRLERETARLGKAAGILDSLSPFKVMSRGFSVITMRGKMINSTHQLKAGIMSHSGWQTERFQLRFCKEAKAVSKNTEKKSCRSNRR